MASHLCGPSSSPSFSSPPLSLSPSLSLSLSVYPLTIATRGVWRTSHSASPTRTNALITLSYRQQHTEKERGNCENEKEREQDEWKERVGVGEVGLPPKKAHIYLSDFADVLLFVQRVVTAHISSLSPSSSSSSSFSVDPFTLISDLPLLSHNYFSLFRESLQTKEPIFLLLSSLLYYTYTLDLSVQDDGEGKKGGGEERAGRFAMETAIFDLWSQLLNIPLLFAVKGSFSPSSLSLSSTHYNTHRPTCYTISITEDEEEIEREVTFARSLSNWLKIKLDNDIERCRWMLKAIHAVDLKILANSSSSSSSSSPRVLKWCIDANTAWTPATATKMLNDVLQPYLHLIYMIEQPFPVWGHGCAQEEEKEWIRVKEEYNKAGVLIYADESFCTKNDIAMVRPFVNGVNIKVEKTGGISHALAAIHSARAAGLCVWIGQMLSGIVASTASSLVFDECDVVGDLDSPSLLHCLKGFEGGMKLNEIGEVCVPLSVGLGVKRVVN